MSVPTSADLARSDALDSKRATLKAAEAVLEAALESRVSKPKKRKTLPKLKPRKPHRDP